MKRLVALFPIALALGGVILVPGAGAREPAKIRTCQTINQPGSYELVDNLSATGDCLVIAADFVTIDLAGFSISGNPAVFGNGIRSFGKGTAVRNGSISGFSAATDLEATGSIVERLRVSGGGDGIVATGVVKDNTVTDVTSGTGIVATGTVIGNYVSGNGIFGISVLQGSTVIGNTVTDNGRNPPPGLPVSAGGIVVQCPSNVTDNTAVNNGHANLVLNGAGCNNTNNVAP